MGEINLIKHYDEIMKLIESSKVKCEMTTVKIEGGKSAGKSYSTLNTPQNQLNYIKKIMKGDKL